MPTLFIHGFPGLYGGAATELYHQILCWEAMGIDLAIIPTMHGYKNEPLYKEMLDLGVTIHEPNQFEVITRDDAIINFCSREYLEALPEIVKHTKRTMFVNCMTFIFEKGYERNEVWNHREGNIAVSLYQRHQIRDMHKHLILDRADTKARFVHFVPYFERNKFRPNKNKDKTRFTIGRISRQDADKFTANQWAILEGILSPVWKRGIVLGWDDRSREKCGDPLPWVETYLDHTYFSVEKFYHECDIILQATETNENWPRIGFEAMFSGVPLVVDKRAGWLYMVEHGVTGFLCDGPKDFIYYGSKLAYEPETRERVSQAAFRRAIELSSYDASSHSWREILTDIFS